MGAAVATTGRTMTKHDVMRETGLPRTTVIRSLGELDDLGGVALAGPRLPHRHCIAGVHGGRRICVSVCHTNSEVDALVGADDWAELRRNWQ